MNVVSDPQTEKAKPQAKTQSHLDMFILIFTCLPIVFLLPLNILLLLLLVLIVLRYMFQFYFNRQVGGITGDCLGASQQITELCIYLLFIAQGI